MGASAASAHARPAGARPSSHRRAAVHDVFVRTWLGRLYGGIDMARLLIADDQVPDRKFLSDQEIRDHYLRALGGQQHAKFVEGFVYLRGLIRLLGDNGYEVDCATTPEVVIDL